MNYEIGKEKTKNDLKINCPGVFYINKYDSKFNFLEPKKK